MSIDRGLVDNDHKCLISIINDVQVIHRGPNLPKQVAEILTRLDIYASTHFEREERLQSAVAFPDADEHHQHHAELLGQLDVMRSEWASARAPNDMVAFHVHLCDFLHHWLIDHILKDDLLMKPFVAEMRRLSREVPPLEEAVAARQG
jgi:hemerythrin